MHIPKVPRDARIRVEAKEFRRLSLRQGLNVRQVVLETLSSNWG